jgi:hypothetical protein
MISPWIISTAALTLPLIVSFYYCYKFAKAILRTEDAIEESLDVLDERYESISQVLDTPLFYKSPEIQRVLSDIETSRHAVLYVANRLVSVDSHQGLRAQLEPEKEQELGD